MLIRDFTLEERLELVQLAEFASELDFTNNCHDAIKKRAIKILTKLGFPQETGPWGNRI